jgi:hypothetical protein
MRRETVEGGGDVLIQLDGTFDAVAAWGLKSRLGALPRDANVVLDFSQVREFYDLGLAVMASSFAEREGPHVAVRGLCQHQHRLLRYFGVDLEAMRAAAHAVTATAAQPASR